MAAKYSLTRKLHLALAKLSSSFFPIDLRKELRSLLRDLNIYRIQLEKDNQWLLRTQAELQETHHKIVDLFNNAPIGYLSLDSRGVITAVNAKACRILGKPQNGLIAHPLSSFVANGDRDKLVHHIDTSRMTDREVVTSLRFSAASGKEIILQLISERWNRGEADPETSEVRTALVDVSSARMDYGAAVVEPVSVTPRPSTHDEADADKTQEKQFQEMIDSSPAIIVVKNLAGRYLVTNHHFERLLGKKREELKGKTDYDLFPKRRANRYRVHDREVVRSGGPQQDEETIEFPGLRRRVYLADRFPLYDKQGRIYAVCAILQDITNRKEREETLRRSEERLRYHVENAPLAVVEWEKGTFVKRWSKRAAEMFGYSPEEALGKTIDDLHLVYPDDIQIVAERNERLAGGFESSVISENRNVTKDGRVITCIWFNSVLRNAKGEMTSVLSRVEDVTEERSAKESLERTVKSLGVLVANSKERMVLFDNSGTILYASERAASTLGFSPEQIQGRSWQLFLPQEQLFSAMFCFADLLKNPSAPTMATLKLLSASGDLVWVSLLASVVSLGDADGFLVHVESL